MIQENYKAENTDELVRLRLNRLKSTQLCKKLIRNKSKGNELSKELLESKAIGLASAIESALGYWDSNSQSLNSRILSRYYFLLQLTIAEQVSKTDNKDDLATVQKHTERGHGLGIIRDSSKNFPHDFFSFSLLGGHFHSYLISLGFVPKDFAFEKRPRKFDDVKEPEKLVGLIDLFRRIPELSGVIEEYCGEPPLSFNVGHADINLVNDAKVAKSHLDKTGEPQLAHKNDNHLTTYVVIYSNSSQVTPEFLSSLNLPLNNFHYADGLSKSKQLIGSLERPPHKHWYQTIDIYSSGYSSKSIITPLWDRATDAIVINFTLLYSLSIIVRYYPDLWYQMTSGEFDQYGSLVDYYISIMDHVLALKMLERITETSISIHQPGSIFGSI